MIALHMLRYYASRAPNLTSKYTVLKGYLVPKQSNRISGGYSTFIKQKYSEASEAEKKQGVTVNMKKYAEIWKDMSANQKSKYKVTAGDMDKLKKTVEDHKAKFITPIKDQGLSLYNFFKKTSGANQKYKGLSIAELAKEQKKDFDKLSAQQLESLKSSLDKHVKQAKKSLEAISEYLIPTSKFYDVQEYYRHKLQNSGVEQDLKGWKSKFKKLTEKELAELKRQFKQKFSEFKGEVEKFVEKRGLPKTSVSRILKREDLSVNKEEGEKESESKKEKTPSKPRRKSSESKSEN